MVTHPKAHHVLFLALVFGVGAASPCLARLAEEDFSTGETTTNLSGFAGIVRSYADDFTDATQLVILQLSDKPSFRAEEAVRVEYHKDGVFSINQYSTDAIQQEDHEGGLFVVSFFDINTPSRSDEARSNKDVEVVFRVGALEAVTLTARTQNGRALVRVSEAWAEELLANMVRGAETIVYRIGSRSRPIRRVSVPAKMPELVAEFWRRVAEASRTSAVDEESIAYHETSLTRLEELADTDDVGAMEELGRRYRNGIGVTADLEVAIEWFHMAAAIASNDGIMAYVTYLDIIEKHGPEAEEINREIMLDEYGESLIEALAWFDIDAACHEEAADFRDAIIGVLGPVRVERAQERAAELRTKGAIVADPGSCDVESMATAQEIDYDTATADVLREAAHRGDRRAMLAIGLGYLDGVLAGVDENAAEAWLAEVSARGVVEGMTAFGVLSNELSARAFDADPDGDEWLHLLYQAYAWFAMAADCGSLDSAEWKAALSDGMNADVLATAERITQRMYDTFFTDLPESEEACIWLESVPPAAPHVVNYMYATTERLRELANGEDVAAMVSLGHRYLLGYLVARDLEKAERWFSDAALRGGPVGMFGLALVLVDVSVAKFEADPDDDESHDLLLGAYAWAAIAADCGFGKAAQWNAETFKGFDAEFWRLAQKRVGVVFEEYFGERTLVNVCLRWE